MIAERGGEVRALVVVLQGPLSGSSRVDGGANVVDIGAAHSAIVVFDDDFTIGLNGSDGTETGMFIRRSPLNALPYYRIRFR